MPVAVGLDDGGDADLRAGQPSDDRDVAGQRILVDLEPGQAWQGWQAGGGQASLDAAQEAPPR
jgi:hypothetical protein